jgi:hypothetical protein
LSSFRSSGLRARTAASIFSLIADCSWGRNARGAPDENRGEGFVAMYAARFSCMVSSVIATAEAKKRKSRGKQM